MGNYLVIGGSSGIGKSLVEKLETEGHSILATYNLHAQSNRPTVQYFKHDVLHDILDESVLPDSLDGLIYCVGSIALKPFHRIQENEFLDDYRLQVIGCIKSIQTCLPRLKKSNQASIVLFSSVAAQTGMSFHSMVSANKGAIEGLTLSLAAEFAPTIRVNCIAPSLTETPLAAQLLNTDQKRENLAQKHPMKRIGTAQDLAEMAYFLVQKSSWITGQIIHVDGGMSSIK